MTEYVCDEQDAEVSIAKQLNQHEARMSSLQRYLSNDTNHASLSQRAALDRTKNQVQFIGSGP